MHIVFFFIDTTTTEIYPLSLHDDLPITRRMARRWDSAGCRLPHASRARTAGGGTRSRRATPDRDPKSTRLNSSHTVITYDVFCFKKQEPYVQYHGDSLAMHSESV